MRISGLREISFGAMRFVWTGWPFPPKAPEASTGVTIGHVDLLEDLKGGAVRPLCLWLAL